MSVEPITNPPPSVHYYGADKRGKHTKRHARPGEWEEIYFEKLREGYAKTSAAALAGVAPDTPNGRRIGDAEFREKEIIAYNFGTANVYEKRAQERIADNEKPADRVLTHMLGHRGITSTQKIEMSGGVDVNVTHNLFPIEKLPLALRVIMLACLDGWELPPELESEMLRMAPVMEMKRITNGNGKEDEK